AKVAEFLLQIKAVKLNPNQPYTWASGWKSPIYCDNRITLSYPSIRTFIRQAFAKMIEDRFGKPDIIAGVATAGIPQGVLVAEALALPYCYVRPTMKGHGLKNQVEGEISEGQNVVIIEDLISTGKSCLGVVSALRKRNLFVKGVASIFDYGFDESNKAFKEAKCSYASLTNYDVLIEQALEANYITEEELGPLLAWKKDPANWDSPKIEQD
ncbi:MAG: orotate phosphoribosyltransferase, partial [Bacteroidia bacterium]|nr:orotate phosphoribosyltransferase [Bacteroidia bacterium]